MPYSLPRQKSISSDGYTDLPPDDPWLVPLNSFSTISDGLCRWPIGAGPTADCCGRACDGTRPYCETHSKRAYNKIQRPSEELISAGHAYGMLHVKKQIPRSTLLAALHSAEDMGL